MGTDVTPSRAAAIAATAALCAVLSGCGGSDDSADPAASPSTSAGAAGDRSGPELAQAVADLMEDTPFRATASGEDSTGTVRAELVVAPNGAHELIEHSVDGSMESLSIGQDVWGRYSGDILPFELEDPDVWLHSDASTAEAILGASLDGRGESPFDPAADFSAVTLGEPEEVDGVPALVLENYPLDDDGTGTVWVAAEGEPWPLRTVGTSQFQGESVTQETRFSDFGEVEELTPPPADQTMEWEDAFAQWWSPEEQAELDDLLSGAEG
ncbi:hypothetical protein [Allostreptomyces psammosilenae]|uniref:Uncharacterized protein n=1 Tax=Allostreptomyces psammosilenae TaxID=1892865 RepID=A0A852ZX29_9ACTN|nr:hypothetical protein [Allostreptomyces psammosilenae]NYI06257.1 hypothetical protein [Allostreptomyces psammosilenae]